MIQLAKDFYIVSIEKNNWTNSRLENNTTYTFKYKNYKLELRPSFDILGYTKEDNMAILIDEKVTREAEDLIYKSLPLLEF